MEHFFFPAIPFPPPLNTSSDPLSSREAVGVGGSSPRASARRLKKGGGSPSVWSVTPKGSSSRFALHAHWAVQLKKAPQRHV